MSSYTKGVKLDFNHPKDGFAYVFEPFSYRLLSEDGDEFIHIPNGFITDGMSMPWWINYIWLLLGFIIAAPLCLLIGAWSLIVGYVIGAVIGRLMKFEKHGKYLKAFVVHDGAYESRMVFVKSEQLSFRIISRKEADKILFEALLVKKCHKIKSWIVYRALRAFGWIAWAKHRRNDYGAIPLGDKDGHS